MGEFALRRLLLSLTALFGVVSIVFVLLHASGDPVTLLVSQDATRDDMERIRQAYGLDQPLGVQYVRYLARVARGDLGYSFRQGLPVAELILERLRATFELALAGLVVAVGVGVSLGLVAAAWRGSLWDTAAMTVALLGTSVPSFWLGLLLIIVFGVHLGWLPISGYGGLAHLVMPAVVLGGFYGAQISRLTRASLLEVLAQDYIRTARAKGLSGGAVLLRHGLRNGLLPILTVLGLDFGRMLGGAVIVESIFAWPGMGRLAVQAVLARDFPVVQGVTIVGAAVFLSVNFVIDLLYGWVDPRLRASAARA
ncbi:MAG: ABC transporter permease [Armatimonadota bacterium]|nr:ABC transporter permease [Armatimonadota bacterium]MDR7472325.1 ABC transporter permease [Armatimonadota bacterium]MDR7506372.1 ABC transporter permease [Armatimonadota bacterium]MDR7508413.1 ABC transporter permease [Armatimonadota bacterium]MDR7516169.1 ABC transporter permease [Armatimonadota bacterium]